VDDDEIDVVAEIDPYGNEESEVRDDKGGVKIVEGLRCLVTIIQLVLTVLS